jgi:hypothetical protein
VLAKNNLTPIKLATTNFVDAPCVFKADAK